MSNLRRSFERFCYQNRDKGIPNLMLYIILGNAIVILLSMFNGGTFLYDILCFNKTAILKGQVWRLFTYVFTQSGASLISLIFLYFFYMIGRHVELSMGTLRFNLFYFSGVLLMDVFAMIFCPVIPDAITSNEQLMYLQSTVPVYMDMAYYLHLSLILTYITAYPNAQFMIFFIIPVRAWVLGILYLVLTLASVFNLSYPVFYFPHNLFPLVALGNYLLFAGRDIINLLPLGLRMKLRKKAIHPKGKPIPFEKKVVTSIKSKAPSYTHRCAVCGKTDVSHPELEFRYCSRCEGYFCYCEEHIDNHTHVQ